MTPLEKHCTHVQRRGFRCSAEPGDPCVDLSENGEWAALPGFHQERIGNPDKSHFTLESLTPGERRIVMLVVQGMSQKAIAAKLEISVETIKRHMQNIYERRGYKSAGQLIVAYFEAYYTPRVVR